MLKVIKNKELAKILKEESGNVYFIPEFQDMLKILTHTIEKLVLEGHSVQLLDFGTFQPKISGFVASASQIQTSSSSLDVLHTASQPTRGV